MVHLLFLKRQQLSIMAGRRTNSFYIDDLSFERLRQLVAVGLWAINFPRLFGVTTYDVSVTVRNRTAPVL